MSEEKVTEYLAPLLRGDYDFLPEILDWVGMEGKTDTPLPKTMHRMVDQHRALRSNLVKAMKHRQNKTAAITASVAQLDKQLAIDKEVQASAALIGTQLQGPVESEEKTAMRTNTIAKALSKKLNTTATKVSAQPGFAEYCNAVVSGVCVCVVCVCVCV